MYKDSRPVHSDAVTASTPEMWADAFAASTRMNPWRALRFRRTREWGLIKRYVRPGAAVLDAGCGFGEWVCFLAERGYRAEGLDFSEVLVSRLRNTYPHLTWQHGDVRQMPYPAGRFDAVVSWGVIEHDEAGPARALREFGRVLKPGGMIIVTVPVDSPAQRHATEYLYRRGSAPHAFFQYFMTDEELVAQVAAAGFDVVEQGVLPNAVVQLLSPRLAGRLNRFWLRLANLAVSTSLSWMPRYCVMRYCVAASRQR